MSKTNLIGSLFCIVNIVVFASLMSQQDFKRDEIIKFKTAIENCNIHGAFEYNEVMYQCNPIYTSDMNRN